jgi:hypothetical protein
MFDAPGADPGRPPRGRRIEDDPRRGDQDKTLQDPPDGDPGAMPHGLSLLAILDPLDAQQAGANARISARPSLQPRRPDRQPRAGVRLLLLRRPNQGRAAHILTPTRHAEVQEPANEFRRGAALMACGPSKPASARRKRRTRASKRGDAPPRPPACGDSTAASCVVARPRLTLSGEAFRRGTSCEGGP